MEALNASRLNKMCKGKIPSEVKARVEKIERALEACGYDTNIDVHTLAALVSEIAEEDTEQIYG